jgi:hypothetical protein
MPGDTDNTDNEPKMIGLDLILNMTDKALISRKPQMNWSGIRSPASCNPNSK